jgi:class 3 adenylate cyclase
VLKAIRSLSDPFVAVGEGVVEPVTARPQPVPHEAERRQLTVMFVDLVGSTALSVRLDPEEMREVLRSYFDAIAAAIARFDGHVDRLLGDGVLAFFGWPRAHEDDAERAVRAALDSIEAVRRVRTPVGEPLAARVGIATGRVVVGDLIGEGAVREQAVVGDTPNLAARLQALAQPNTVVVAAGTRRLLGELFEFAELGSHDLKCIAEPVRAWRVLGPGRAMGRFEAREAMAGMAPLVGRDAELAQLLRCWTLAREGEGQLALLSGEPGIGKSRLVRAVSERLRTERPTTLFYQSSPHHAHSPLWPVVEQLGRAADIARSDAAVAKLDKLEALLGTGVDDVASLAPFFAELLAVPAQTRYPPPQLTPQQLKQRQFEALLTYLEGLATRRPVLLVIEDAHWIDPTTLELFDLVVQRLRHLRVLLIVTYRPEFSVPWAGHGHPTLLPLTNLSRQEAVALIESVTVGKALPPEVTGEIVAKTDGVPLFVEELTKTVLESGLLRDAGARFALAGPLPPLAIPTTLQDSLLARLDRLAPVKDVAQTAACIGREFSYELLSAVAAQPPRSVRRALEELVAAGLVFGHGEPPEVRYTFKHALVQEAAYRSLLRSRR